MIEKTLGENDVYNLQFEHTQEHGSGMSSIQLVSLSKTILLGTLEEG